MLKFRSVHFTFKLIRDAFARKIASSCYFKSSSCSLSSSSNVEADQNVIIASNGNASADNTNFGDSTPQAADSDNKTDFVNSGTNSYFLNNEFTSSNIKLGSGINNDPIAYAGHMNLVVENLDSDTAMVNQLSFSRTGITPKKD